jgi:hypothetical protein
VSLLYPRTLEGIGQESAVIEATARDIARACLEKNCEKNWTDIVQKAHKWLADIFFLVLNILLQKCKLKS